MKKTLSILILLGLYCFSAPGLASWNQEKKEDLPAQVIHLKDGSMIRGQLVGIQEGHYIIDSLKLGTVQVKAEDVAQITTNDNISQNTATQQKPKTSSRTVGQQALQMAEPVQNMLLSDPQMMSLLQELMEDPELMRLIQDPSFLKTLTAMDPETIKNNPDIQRVFQHPAMQELIRQLQGQIDTTQVPR